VSGGLLEAGRFDAWDSATAYEAYMGRWSAKVAREFLAWLAAPALGTWVDVGSGTGVLARAIAEQCKPHEVVGIEPSSAFRALAAARLPGNSARFVAGEAERLPLDDEVADAVVSGLVLNFVHDSGAALREMRRVLRPGGLAAAYVWDYAEGMQFVRAFWDAAVALDPAAADLDQGSRFDLCRPGALRELFQAAGLERVEERAIEIATSFADFDDFWRPFLGGTGSAPGYVADLSEARRRRLAAELRSRLAGREDGPIEMRARAWAVRGWKQA
jgi:SAM-dependent methyltransferase